MSVPGFRSRGLDSPSTSRPQSYLRRRPHYGRLTRVYNIRTSTLMSETHDLTHLDPNSFEHMVNALALRVLGAGLRVSALARTVAVMAFLKERHRTPVRRTTGKVGGLFSASFTSPISPKTPRAGFLNEFKRKSKSLQRLTRKERGRIFGSSRQTLTHPGLQ
jgi:hypothetical protein